MRGAIDTGAALKAALDLARVGNAVFPCRSDKRPATAHGFHDATDDPAIVKRLWAQCPGPLVGLPTGAINGFDVLDIDTAGMEWLAGNRSRLPSTLTFETRSGGRHLYFRHATGLRCSAGLVAPGVDIRADGGYAVCWPAAGLPIITDVEMTAWPGWLIGALSAKTKPAPNPRGTQVADQRRIAGLIREVAFATEGQRNCKLFWATCRMAEMIGPTLSVEEVRAIMLEAASRCGLPEREAERTIRSAMRGRS